MNFIRKIISLLKLIVETSGLILKPLIPLNIILIGISLIFLYFLNFIIEKNFTIAITYYITFEIGYIGFIYAVLTKNGLKNKIISAFKSEEKAYRFYQSVLGFLFFNNGLSMSYISQTSGSEIFSSIDSPQYILIGCILLFLFGYIIKLWSAKVVGIDIYFWKDMFVNRKICEFVVCGPYRYFSNPMYGIGQLQGYASAILSGSLTGLLVVFINQILVFSFYFIVEKKFIKETYFQKTI